MASTDESYAEPVRGMLRKYSARLLPLTKSADCDRDSAAAIQQSGAHDLFPGARAPEAALSGLLLLGGCWDESHRVSQDIPTAEGSYWHAIAHRMEPDASNSAYWFRRVGQHSIFPELQRQAMEIALRSGVDNWPMKNRWDAFAFIDWCERARQAPGSDIERVALEVQRVEWDLLFAWCAKPVWKAATNHPLH